MVDWDKPLHIHMHGPQEDMKVISWKRHTDDEREQPYSLTTEGGMFYCTPEGRILGINGEVGYVFNP